MRFIPSPGRMTVYCHGIYIRLRGMASHTYMIWHQKKTPVYLFYLTLFEMFTLNKSLHIAQFTSPKFHMHFGAKIIMIFKI